MSYRAIQEAAVCRHAAAADANLQTHFFFRAHPDAAVTSRLRVPSGSAADERDLPCASQPPILETRAHGRCKDEAAPSRKPTRVRSRAPRQVDRESARASDRWPAARV